MSEEDLNMLRSDYKQLVSMVIGITSEQSKHAEVAKHNSEAIGDIKALLGEFQHRLVEHMEDEEGKIETNAAALRDLASSVERLSLALGPLHIEQHGWLAEEIQRQKTRHEFWTDMGKSAARWGIIGALGLLVTILWSGLQEYIHRGGN
jgi:hypothetical protein